MQRQLWRPWLLAFYAFSALAAGVVLFQFDPSQSGYYPRCLLHAMTGIQCPGCGGLRATHHLLHGDLWGAFQLNPLVFVLLPLLAAWWAGHSYQLVTGRRVPRPFDHPAWLWTLIAVCLIFGVARNIWFLFASHPAG